MPGVTPLLHTVVKGEANPYSTVYISPTDGVTDSSVTLGEGTDFKVPIGFYAGSKALVKVVRPDGTRVVPDDRPQGGHARQGSVVLPEG